MVFVAKKETGVMRYISVWLLQWRTHWIGKI